MRLHCRQYKEPTIASLYDKVVIALEMKVILTLNDETSSVTILDFLFRKNHLKNLLVNTIE